jgi:hypothetical protein
MEDFTTLEEKDFGERGVYYQLCGHTFALNSSHFGWYLNRIGGDHNTISESPAGSEFNIRDIEGLIGPGGYIRQDIDDFLGYRTRGFMPEVKSLEDVAKLYNFIGQRWIYLNKIANKGVISDDLIKLPYEVQSQGDWDRVWPILKKAGFTWTDGEELDHNFSECHEFPEIIEQESDLKISIG